ncbi:transmembrane protein 238-like isoform X2 [Scyliorhinus canicula]|uniref:transmembrane protein 238-like isoform X2 n=1 Tax=Scyliorhinus canicula TaxID=7830 RepID=UPI0018F2ED16|nr:transmembrane protein 238-like isoform X2 [Scyliorhinus canicula]
MVLGGMGRCPGFFCMAVSLDVAGLTLLLIGIFANVRVGGRGFGDCLVYSGSIIVFLSLIWWLFWCTGNIEVPLEELEKEPALEGRLARRFSQRLSVKSQGSPEEADKLGKEGELSVREIATAISWDMVVTWHSGVPKI